MQLHWVLCATYCADDQPTGTRATKGLYGWVVTDSYIGGSSIVVMINHSQQQQQQQHCLVNMSLTCMYVLAVEGCKVGVSVLTLKAAFLQQ
jgi:hypothetical protein